MAKGLEKSNIMVIFGGTGDLTHRKLIPALYNLYIRRELPSNFAVVAIGRRDKSDVIYREELSNSIKQFSRFKWDNDKAVDFLQNIYYKKFDFSDNDGYVRLNEFLEKKDTEFNTHGNRIFYLAVAPEYFDIIVEKLKHHDLVGNSSSWQRLVIEKPFGSDLDSAIKLNQKISRVFSESDIYRIDHYLGKEMMQNIMTIRFANLLFEPIWNSRYISNIQITSSETVGVETRGGYYEKSGALRDMVQNHMLQLLTLTAMEPPVNLDPDSIRDEKVKLLKSLEQLPPNEIVKKVIRGQYGPGIINNVTVPGYREEDKVAPDSQVETFVAMKINIENFRWGDTPFYIRTGKRLPEKVTQIVIQFKELPGILYKKIHENLEPNLLVISIQPQEGVFLQFNAKKPGEKHTIIPVQMDFRQNHPDSGNSPEAYERLLHDVMEGDSTLFTRWDEVEYSWKFIDGIINKWVGTDPQFPNYAAGTWGPVEADKLLEADGTKWWTKGVKL